MILFWIHYVLAIILLYHILICIYVKGECRKISPYYSLYSKSENDTRLKRPLWVILLLLIVLCIPVLNIICYIIVLLTTLTNGNGEEDNKYYCKSIFTKRY